MNKIRYADAGMDMKKMVLLFARNIWVILLVAVIGAVTSGAVYTIANTVPESQRQYRCVSKLYLDFATDETGEVYQAYNGYTWNDLMSTAPILDVTMQFLPAEYSRSEVTAATQATILSDLRLLTITITTNDPTKTMAIALATNQSLERLGDNAKEFLSIKTIETTDASLVVADSRLVQAVGVGFTVSLLLMVFVVLLLQIVDDRIVVAGDLRYVTEIPFAGYIGEEQNDIVKNADCENTFGYLHQKYQNLEVLVVKQGKAIEEKEWQNLRRASGIVLQIPYKRVHAAYLAYLLELLETQDCKVVGIAISDGDVKWLKRYYGRVWRS